MHVIFNVIGFTKAYIMMYLLHPPFYINTGSMMEPIIHPTISIDDFCLNIKRKNSIIYKSIQRSDVDDEILKRTDKLMNIKVARNNSHLDQL